MTAVRKRTPAYVASSIRRHRRTKAEIEFLRKAIISIVGRARARILTVVACERGVPGNVLLYQPEFKIVRKSLESFTAKSAPYEATITRSVGS